MSTTAPGTATGTHTRDLGRDRRLIEVDWQRCGSAARELLREGGRHHRDRSTDCWAGPGIRAAWSAGTT